MSSSALQTDIDSLGVELTGRLLNIFLFAVTLDGYVHGFL
jgi:hypothetical protein